jgi:hypothetical protein
MLAARGCKVFRIKAGTKDFYIDKKWADEPLDSFDVLDAFTRPDGQCAGYNYGVNAGASDLVIVDVDTKHGIDGFANLATLGALPRTFTVRSPSGGKHFYFRANGLKLTQRPLCPNVDLRSFHGYVIGPGSWTPEIKEAGRIKQFAGVYEVVDDSDFADLPEWIKGRAKEAGTRGQLPPLFEPDTEGSIEAGIAYVSSLPVAVAGTINNILCDTIRAVFDRGCSWEMTRDILGDHFQSDPPVSAEEIAALCERIDESYEGPRGKELAGWGFEPVASEVKDDAEEARAKRFEEWCSRPAISEQEEAALKVTPWLMHKRMLMGSITELVAPGGSGKSLLTMQWAAAVVLGDEAADALGCRVYKTGRVLVMNNEDPTDEMNRRMNAVCRHFNLNRDKVADGVMFRSGAENALCVVGRKDQRSNLERTEALADLIAYVKRRKFVAVIVDPLVDFHQADENKNTEMAVVMQAWRALAAATGAAVLIVHHTAKPGAVDQSGNANAGRGASAVVNAARAAATLFTMTKDDAEKYGISPDKRVDYKRLDDAKANLTRVSAQAEWYQNVSVDLLNGEQRGVLVPVKLEAAEKSDRNMMALEIAARLTDKMSVSEASRMLAECDMFSGHSASALAKRICKAFISEETTETPQGRLLFVGRGKEGGEFSFVT